MNETPKISPITLPAQLTDAHRLLLLKYARLPRSITRSEWVSASAAFDLLHVGQVKSGRKTLTFQQFYNRHIDAVYATEFLSELSITKDSEIEGSRLTNRYWQKIASSLSEQGVSTNTVEAQLLLVYCLYWWQSFSKGYIREVAVFHDLKQAGIRFEAHDLLDSNQRRSPYDLTVLNRHGDIKTSTYFLHNARLFPLRCDFYIVRLFDE